MVKNDFNDACNEWTEQFLVNGNEPAQEEIESYIRRGLSEEVAGRLRESHEIKERLAKALRR